MHRVLTGKPCHCEISSHFGYAPGQGKVLLLVEAGDGRRDRRPTGVPTGWNAKKGFPARRDRCGLRGALILAPSITDLGGLNATEGGASTLRCSLTRGRNPDIRVGVEALGLLVAVRADRVVPLRRVGVGAAPAEDDRVETRALARAKVTFSAELLV